MNLSVLEPQTYFIVDITHYIHNIHEVYKSEWTYTIHFAMYLAFVTKANWIIIHIICCYSWNLILNWLSLPLTLLFLFFFFGFCIKGCEWIFFLLYFCVLLGLRKEDFKSNFILQEEFFLLIQDQTEWAQVHEESAIYVLLFNYKFVWANIVLWL